MLLPAHLLLLLLLLGPVRPHPRLGGSRASSLARGGWTTSPWTSKCYCLVSFLLLLLGRFPVAGSGQRLQRRIGRRRRWCRSRPVRLLWLCLPSWRRAVLALMSLRRSQPPWPRWLQRRRCPARLPRSQGSGAP